MSQNLLRNPKLLLAVLLLVVPTVLGAASGEGCRALPGAGSATDPVEVCESQAWFARDGDTRVANAGGLARAVGQDEPALPSWSPDPPEESVTEGAGALYTAHTSGEALGAPGVATARFEGTFTGNLDTIALNFYMVTSHEYDEYLPPGTMDASRSCQVAAACEGIYPIQLTLEIDGHEIDLGQVDSYLYPPSTSGNVLAMRFRVAVAGLFDGIDDPSAVHDVAIEVRPHEDETTLLFDAAEWPSKILFNPADTTSYRVVSIDHDHADHNG